MSKKSRTPKLATAALVVVFAIGSLTGCGANSKANADATCGEFEKMSSGDRSAVASAVLKEVQAEDTILTNKLIQGAIISYCSAVEKDTKVSEGISQFKELKEKFGWKI